MRTVDPRNVKYLFNKALVILTSRIVLRKLGEDSKALFSKEEEILQKKNRQFNIPNNTLASQDSEFYLNSNISEKPQTISTC